MTERLALLVNVPNAMYKQIIDKYDDHDGCWMQQDRQLKRQYLPGLLAQIKSSGHTVVYMYVRKRLPLPPVAIAADVDKIVTGDVRVPPPEGPATEFADYDVPEGKCKGKDDFKYRTWLHISGLRVLEPPLPLSAFTSLLSNKPLEKVRGHTPFYVRH